MAEIANSTGVTKTGLIPLPRKTIEAEIERLIEMLDDADDDPDIEENGDERDQSYAEGWRPGGAVEDDEDGGDNEPSLAAPEARSLPVDYFYAQRSLIVQSGPMGSQESWARGSSGDGEENVEDEGEATNEDGGNVLDEPHDAEEDCSDAVDEPIFPYKGERDRPMARALLARLPGRQERRDPDELTVIAPGIARVGT